MRKSFANFMIVAAMIISQSGCKSRSFNAALKGSESADNYDFSELLQSISKGKPNPSQNILVYVHGFNYTTLPQEDFISIAKKDKAASPEQLSASWVDTLVSQNWNVMNFAWHTFAKTKTLPPVGPERLLWNLNVPSWNLSKNKDSSLENTDLSAASPDLRVDTKTGLGFVLCSELTRFLMTAGPKKGQNPPVEIRLVGHNLGSQIAVICGYQLVSTLYKDWPEQQKKIRVELLDPILGSSNSASQKVNDVKFGTPSIFREQTERIQLGMMKELNAKAVPIVAYGATLNRLLSNSFFAGVLFQQMNANWLKGNKNINQLEGIRDAYFRSFTDTYPPIVSNSADTGNSATTERQGFSAKYTTDAILKLAPPMLLAELGVKNPNEPSFAGKVFQTLIDPKKQADSMEEARDSNSLVIVKKVNETIPSSDSDDLFTDDSGPGAYTSLSQDSGNQTGFSNEPSPEQKQKASRGVFAAIEKLKKLGFIDLSLPKGFLSWMNDVLKSYPFSKSSFEEVSCTEAVKVTTQMNREVARSEPVGIPPQLVLDRCKTYTGFTNIMNAQECIFGATPLNHRNKTKLNMCGTELIKMFHPDKNQSLLDAKIMTASEFNDRKDAFVKVDAAKRVLKNGKLW